MKNKRKKSPSVKIRSDARTSRIRSTYQKNIAKGKEKAFSELDKLFEELSKYYGKRGKVLKSKLRSNKAKASYNELLKKIESLGTAPKRAAKSKEVQVNETAEQLSDYFGMTGAHAKEAAEIFVNQTLPVASLGYKPSEVVLILAEAGFDSNTILNILNYIDREIEFRTPDEMKKFRTEDDIYKFVSHMASLKQLAPDIPTEDIIKLSEQMLMYDLDNYDEVINEYRKDTENIWNDEYDEDGESEE